MSKIVAVIPVRGGSQGVPRKNLRLVAGKPLLRYTIDCARNAARIQRVVVSTEDREIADFAASSGAEVFRHPAILSGPEAPTYPVVQWDLQHLRTESAEPSLLVVLRATTPLRTPEDIDNAISLLDSNPIADSVVSVGLAVGVHPIRLKRILDDGRLMDAFEQEGRFPRRRQALEALYVRNGAIYAARPFVIDAGGLWGGHCLAYLMPEERSININTEYQLRVAELLLLYCNEGHASQPGAPGDTPQAARP